MLSRRAALLAAAAASTVFVTPAFSTETRPFAQGDFAAAQKAGKPIFVAIHATWCLTAKAAGDVVKDKVDDAKSLVEHPDQATKDPVGTAQKVTNLINPVPLPVPRPKIKVNIPRHF